MQEEIFEIIPLTDISTDKSNEKVYFNNQIIYNTNNNYAIIFLRDGEQYLIKNLQKHFKIITFSSGIFILNKLNGIVYFYFTKNKNSFANVKDLFKDAIDHHIDNKFCLLNFTKQYPIKKIVTKFINYFAMIARNGDVFLFSNSQKEKQHFTKQNFNNEKIIDVSCGFDHVLFLSENNNLYGLGRNLNGSLSISNETSDDGKTFENITKCNTTSLNGKKITKIVTNYQCSFVLTQNGDLFSSGNSTYGTNGQPKNSHCTFFTKIKENVKNVSVGYFFVAIQTFCNEHFIFGSNNFNQFGQVDKADSNGDIVGTSVKFNFVRNTGKEIIRVKQLECGGYHSILLTDENKIYYSGMVRNYLLPQREDYTEIKMSKFIPNWENVKTTTKELKIKSGLDFTMIYSKKRSQTLTFRNAHKLSDVSFHF
ncbi:hypothetical protein ABK040_005527 [Willaertia magna]